MESKIWGPSAWIFLHSITLNYPENPTQKDKKEYKSFFYSLSNILPCKVCQINYKNNLIKYPIDKYLNSKKNMVYWLILIHNEVNRECGKKQFTYTEAIKNFDKLYSEGFSENIISETKNETIFTTQNIRRLSFIGLLSFLGILLFKKIKNNLK